MPLPEFNKRGVLKRGIHICTTAEFIDRFCSVEGSIRSKYTEALEQLFAYAVNRCSKSIIFGGSFITSKKDPKDLDCMVIMPNKKCMTVLSNEFLVLDDCELDLLVVAESEKDSVYDFINLLSKDKLDLDVGLVEVCLDEEKDKSTWSDYDNYYSFEKLMDARAAYINRHFIKGPSKRKVLITLLNARDYISLNFNIAPIVSSNGWIFAPYCYHIENINKDYKHFRSWLDHISHCYETNVCIFADGIGSLLLGKYIKDNSVDYKAQFDRIIVSNAILDSAFDWSSEYGVPVNKSIISLRSSEKEYIVLEKLPKSVQEEVIYGEAYKDGFSSGVNNLVEYPFNYNQEINLSTFKNTILPMFHMSSLLEKNIYRNALEELIQSESKECNLHDIWLEG